MSLIRVTVQNPDGNLQQYVGVAFQQGDKALAITTQQGTQLVIPNSSIKVYEVQQVQGEEQTGDASVATEVPPEDSAVEEESDTKKEEAS